MSSTTRLSAFAFVRIFSITARLPSGATSITGQMRSSPPATPATLLMRPPRTKNVRSDEKNQCCTSWRCSRAQAASSSRPMPSRLRPASLSMSMP